MNYMTRPAVLRLLQLFDRGACASEERERTELDGVYQSLRRQAAHRAEDAPGEGASGASAAPWCERADVLEAMKAALAERTDGSPMYELALVLVRSGVVDPATTACLEPWRQSPFLWRQRALTGAKISDFLLMHGFRPMTPAGAAMVDAAIADPAAAVEDTGRLWPAIFGHQLVKCPLDAGAMQPRADQLFSAFAAAARPAVPLADLKQVLEPGCWRVSFRCLGQRHGFSVEHRGSRLDVDAVVSAFNALMAHVDHPCGAFRIDHPMPPLAHVVVTRGERFEAAARTIGIPLARSVQPVARTT
ncbi:MAG: hypothetical protein ACK515_25530 [bacterium]|jgi:hypothetical protein|nr:hypothetical protein [Betaproteobacteria bacterium]